MSTEAVATLAPQGKLARLLPGVSWLRNHERGETRCAVFFLGAVPLVDLTGAARAESRGTA